MKASDDIKRLDEDPDCLWMMHAIFREEMLDLLKDTYPHIADDEARMNVGKAIAMMEDRKEGA